VTTTIADSDAFRDPDRLLPQHQAALTVLQARVSAPKVLKVSWLDLACGRGQILQSLDTNLSVDARAKIDYLGYDLDQERLRQTEGAALRLGFASQAVKVGELIEFNHVLPVELRFDFITLTNTVHEIEPRALATLLVHCLGRLTDTGMLFVYDMDRLKPPELGAVPWNRDDVRTIVWRLLDDLGEAAYRPEVGLWSHRTCNGWNVQLERQHLGVSSEDLINRATGAILKTEKEILQILQRRLAECRAALEAVTKRGAETGSEEDEKQRLLFEFWALYRAVEASA
jgi:hypothetical protein